MSKLGRSKLLSTSGRRILETELFELTKSQKVPVLQNEFRKFVEEQFGGTKYPASVIKSVWHKLKKRNKSADKSTGLPDTSSPSSGEDSNNCHLTHLIDFDVPYAENEPAYLIIMDTDSSRNAETKVRVQQRSQRSSPKNSTIPREPKKSPKKRLNEDRALLKKFRQKIFLEELLNRDRQMLEVKGRINSIQEAAAIESEYSQRIQKDRVDALAMEMLRQHYLDQGLGDPQMQEAPLIEEVPFMAEFQPVAQFQPMDELLFVEEVPSTHLMCVVEASQYIPSETVIAERLPNAELLGESSSEFDHLDGSPDFLNSDFFSEPLAENYPASRTSLSGLKKSMKTREKGPDELFLDTVIDFHLPDITGPCFKRSRLSAKS